MNQTLGWVQTHHDTETRGAVSEDVQFNVFEVLRIAEEVEHKAARFFLQAAERFEDRERRTVCYNLAAWRARHREAWSRIRREYSERTGQFGTFDPDNYLLSNPQVMASLTCFGTYPRSRGTPTGKETTDRIVHDAIQRARGVAVFYRGLKGFVHDPESRRMIETMVGEEERHIRLLTGILDRMQQGQSMASLLGIGALAGAVN